MRVQRSLTTTLISIICLFYIWAQFDHTLVDHLALFYGGVYSNGVFPGVSTGQWYRLLTVALTHANLLHLGSNMLALFTFGNLVERIFGRNKYLAIFLGSLLVASLASVYLGPHNIFKVGASGAIFGLLGALLAAGGRSGVNSQAVISNVVLNVVITFSIPGIDWRAHVGGFVGGFAIAYLVKPRR